MEGREDPENKSEDEIEEESFMVYRIGWEIILEVGLCQVVFSKI
jgi:hypothetical protein